jgi:uncharacterized protein involved in exopolysaccharide biosynthesis
MDAHAPFSAVRRRSAIAAFAAIAICTAVGAAIGYSTTRKQNAQYRAEAQLMVQMGREVSSQRPELITLGDAQRIVAPGWREYVNTELTLLKHPSVKEQAIEAVKNATRAKSPGRIGEESITFNAVNVPRSNILRLECTCANGEMAKLVLAKWIEVYQAFHLRVHGQGGLLLFFEAESKRANDDYLAAAAAMASFCAETGLYDFDNDRTALLQQVRSLELKLAEAGLDAADATAKIAELEKSRAESASGTLAQLRADASGANARATALTADLDAVNTRLQKLEEQRARHELLDERVTTTSGILERAVSAERLCRTGQRLDEAGVMNVAILSEPSVQATPITVMGFPHRVADTLFGALFGFVLAAGVLLVVRGLRGAGLLPRRRADSAAASMP